MTIERISHVNALYPLQDRVCQNKAISTPFGEVIAIQPVLEAFEGIPGSFGRNPYLISELFWKVMVPLR